MRRTIVLTLVALTAAAVWLGRASRPYRGTASADRPSGNADAPRDAATTSGADGRSSEAAPVDVAARPRSLRGTGVDGGLLVDAQGRFVPTRDARRLFDYFLTATGEAPDDLIRARIVREIKRRLPPDAARDARTLLEDYLVYRERVRGVADADDPSDDDLDARLATLVALRRAVLGPVAAEAFFADEEADARRLLEQRRIANDPSLPPEERAARIDALVAAEEATLPSETREARATARRATVLRAAEEEIRAHGGSDAEVAAARERLVGPEAAARLAALDRRRAEWRGRVDAFRAARDRLRADPALTPEAREAAVARLLAESFTPAERQRVEAVDRLDR
jgi:lipase chaperone LimK